MTGGKNVFTYMTTEGKRTGKATALEYLQKNTGVFNDRGMISQEKVTNGNVRLMSSMHFTGVSIFGDCSAFSEIKPCQI